MQFIPLAPLRTLDEGVPVAARAQGREFLLIRYQGRIRIFDGACPHAGQPLSRGTLASDRVRCKGHGFEFSLADGRCLNQSQCPALRAYKPVFMGNSVGIDWA